MTLLYLPALAALVLLAAPVLVHLLVHRRAERIVFPSLRFIAPSRLASMRKRMLDDVPLLAVRIAILIAAVAALAAPLVVTAARQREWNARIARASVGDVTRADVARPFPPSEASADRRSLGEGDLGRDFETADLRDGIRRATAWLEAAPPARREIVVSSAFPIGSLTAADFAAVPASIGLRFERTSALPESRTVADAHVLTGADTRVGLKLLARDLTFEGARTSLHEIQIADRASFPVEVDTPAGAKPAIDAAIAAVLSQRVWAPPAGRRARLIVAGSVARPFQGRDDRRGAESPALQINLPWMADAIARMSRDADLQSAASGALTGLRDPRYSSAPWQTVVAAADGMPLIAAAGSASTLLVASAATASDLVTPLLLRSIVNGLAVVPDMRQGEVVAISDAQLLAWSRPAPPLDAPRLDPRALKNLDDDRRWFWAAVLGLLGLETWMRRERAGDAAADERDVARVA